MILIKLDFNSTKWSSYSFVKLNLKKQNQPLKGSNSAELSSSVALDLLAASTKILRLKQIHALANTNPNQITRDLKRLFKFLKYSNDSRLPSI